jgi:hypothetical protein
MKVLPPSTELPAAPIERRHSPRPGAFGVYRPCLRWDFGFTCAFCLNHESDFIEHGAKGTWQMWVEHFVLQTDDTSRIDDYTNCYWSCGYCNDARSRTPNVDAKGRRLLDPCATAWAAHFVRIGDSLRPAAGDIDAEYTWSTYDLDSLRKKFLRRQRDETLTEAFEILERGPGLVRRLREAAEQHASARSVLLDAHAILLAQMKAAHRQVARYAAVPEDRDASCRCGTYVHHSLPAFLEAQVVEVPSF